MEENEKAEEPAKGAAENLGSRRCTYRFTSLTHMNYIFTERKGMETKHRFETKHERHHLTPNERDIIIV